MKKLLFLLIMSLLPLQQAQSMKRDYKATDGTRNNKRPRTESALCFNDQGIPADVIQIILLLSIKIDPQQPWIALKNLYKLRIVCKAFIEAFPSEEVIACFMSIPCMHVYATTANYKKIIETKINHKNNPQCCVRALDSFFYRPLDYANSIYSNKLEILSNVSFLLSIKDTASTQFLSYFLNWLSEENIISQEESEAFITQITCEGDLLSAVRNGTLEQFNESLNRLVIKKGNINCSGFLLAFFDSGKVDLLQQLLAPPTETLSDLKIEEMLDFNVTDINGDTPLCYALNYNEREVFDLLIHQNGININTINKQNNSLLDFSISSTNPHFFNTLVMHDSIDIEPSYQQGKYFPLRRALGLRDKKTIQQVISLEKQHKLSLQPQYMASCLFYAIDHADLEIIKDLVYAGYPLDVENSKGLLPLHCASIRGKNIFLETLAGENAVLINAQSKHQQICMLFTPLHFAAYYNHLECVKELVRLGADCSLKDMAGMTALDIAHGKGHEDIVEELS